MDMEHNENLTPETEAKKKSDPVRELYSSLRDLCIILAAVTVIFVFVVRLVGVSGSSMFPTLVNRDYMLLLSNFVSDDYEQGDIVVATIPSFSKDPIVKRVIAVEGQTVDIDYTTGTVYVDGTALEEPYICEQGWDLSYAEATELPAVVPEGCYFLMGDNRNHSADSRYARIGMVPGKRIMGRVLLIGLPGKQTDLNGNVIGGRDFSRMGAPE